jgi:hypothetical protein
MAKRMSSPLTVLRFSCWHFSEAAARHQRRFRVFGLNLKRTLAGDEGDELAHALLHAFLGLLCDLGVLGQGSLHDAGDWSKVANVSVVGGTGGRALGPVGHGRLRRRRHAAVLSTVQYNRATCRRQRRRANQNDGGWGRGYVPLAIGSHRSCSLTSNS